MEFTLPTLLHSVYSRELGLGIERMKPHSAGRLGKLSCIALAGCLACPAFAHAIALFALTNVNTIVEFESSTPGTLRHLPSLTGFGVGEDLIGIALRPVDRRLYALTKNAVNAGALYTVNISTGEATLVGVLTPALGSSYTTLSGTHFGMKFNPFADRLRLVSEDGTNLRVVPTTAQVVADTALNPGSPHVVGVAYTNSFAGATTTTLYDIDLTSDRVLTQNPPNNGTLIDVGALGVAASDTLGFEIASLAAVDYAYAGLTVGGSTGLYTINLGNGAASLLGNIGTGSVPVISMAADVDYIFSSGFQ
jgi:hypothetical protein